MFISPLVSVIVLTRFLNTRVQELVWTLLIVVFP